MALRLTNDFIFKYVFGREETKDILIDLINAVLSDSGFDPVASIALRSPVNSRQALWLKETVLDVKATDERGRTFDIEIQVEADPAYARSSLFYWAQVYSGQLTRGDEYTELKPVVCINILDFTLFPELTRLHSCFMLHEIRNKEYVLTGDLAIHFIELSKTEGSNHRLAQWRHFIALDTPQEEEMTILLKDDPLMHKAYTEYKKFTQDDELRELALSREKYQRDMASRLGAATREGLAKGMQEGKLEGKLEIARGMKQKGLEPGFIAEVTGLPLEEIGKL